nr:hypothetical protein [Tanacetum cinerariifolium]
MTQPSRGTIHQVKLYTILTKHTAPSPIPGCFSLTKAYFVSQDGRLPLSFGKKAVFPSGRNLREKPLSYRKKEGAARPGKRSTLWLRGMDSPIDESDLGSLSHRRTSLEVEREGNRKGSPSLCLLLAAFLVHPALRRLQIQLQ